MMRGQFFAHGQLRLYLLSLLQEGPRHGYDIIRALTDRFGGMYRPSPGTIYPRLAALEEEGLVEREENGRKTIYKITPAGLTELKDRQQDLATLEQDIAESVRERADSARTDVHDSMSGLRADLAAAAGRARAEARMHQGTYGTSETDKTELALQRARLKRAEATIDRFRGMLRAELREQAAKGRLTELTVETVQTVIDQAGKSVRDTLS